MSTTIDHVVIGGENDGRIILNNSYIGRLLAVGTAWNTIRLGIRLTVGDTGANITGSPSTYFGLHSNPTTTNGPLSATTSHFLGGKFNTSTLFRSAGSFNYQGSGAEGTLVTKVGSTINAAVAQAGYSGVRVIGFADGHRTICVIEITKGSPNYTYTALYPATPTGFDYTADTLVNCMNLTAMSDVRVYLASIQNADTWTLPASTTIAVDEGTNGPLNAVCFAWNRIETSIYVSDYVYGIIN